MKVTYSDQYLQQINTWNNSTGLTKQLANTARAGINLILSNPTSADFIRSYLNPFKKIVLGKVPPPRDEFGVYCIFFEVIPNQITGIENKATEDILHVAWVNNDHFPHSFRANHLDWSTDPCVCRFLELSKLSQIETFDKDTHYGSFEISQKIGDPFFHVKLEVGPIDNSTGERESEAQVSSYFEVNDKKIYKSNSLQVDGTDRGQASRLMEVLTSEILACGHGIEFCLWAPMDDELELMRNVCLPLGYVEVIKEEDLYYFTKTP